MADEVRRLPTPRQNGRSHAEPRVTDMGFLIDPLTWGPGVRSPGLHRRGRRGNGAGYVRRESAHRGQRQKAAARSLAKVANAARDIES